MKLSQYFGVSIAALLAGGIVIGAGALILYDFTGPDLFTGLVGINEAADKTATREDTAKALLGDAKGLTLFYPQAIKGSPYEVTTGIRYGSAKDLAKNKPSFQWCHIAVPEDKAINKSIMLATKSPDGRVTFSENTIISKREIGLLLGFTHTKLAGLSKSHCQWEKKLGGIG